MVKKLNFDLKSQTGAIIGKEGLLLLIGVYLWVIWDCNLQISDTQNLHVIVINLEFLTLFYTSDWCIATIIFFA